MSMFTESELVYLGLALVSHRKEVMVKLTTYESQTTELALAHGVQDILTQHISMLRRIEDELQKIRKEEVKRNEE